MDSAYSLEINEIIDAEKAYDLFQVGIIKDKRAFECIGENCTVQTTCVNVDREVQETKKSVHFRCYGEHSKYCPIGRSETNKKKRLEPKNKKGNQLKNSNVHIFTDRPKDYYQTDKKVSIKIEKSELKEKEKKSYNFNQNSNKPKKHYWIAPIITRFLEYWKTEKENELDQIFVQLKNKQISFSNFFIGINNQNLADLSEYPSIYFGNAFFNSKKGNVVLVNFCDSFDLEGTKIKPSIFLNLDDLKKFKNFNYWEKRFDIVIDTKKPYLFFVYGVPKLNTNKKYINFLTKKLDYLDIRV